MFLSGVAEQFAIAEAKLRAWSSVDGDESNDDSYDEDFLPANDPVTQSTGTQTQTHSKIWSADQSQCSKTHAHLFMDLTSMLMHQVAIYFNIVNGCNDLLICYSI